jgi:cytoskeletal protein CcmA (bactofilin family)
MEKTVNQNISISGSGNASGGVYNQVKVNGSARITSDIECELFTCNGSSHVEGNMKAGKVKINGSTHVDGNMDTKEMTINGSSDIDGNLNCEEIKIQGSSSIKGDLKGKEIIVRGSATVKGNVSGEEVEVRGQVKIDGDCEAESFNARGNFKIKGLLNAGDIEIELLRHCEAREIGGENISVKKTRDTSGFKKLIKFFISQTPDQLTAEIIEGDHIYLEYTNAQVVRGNHIEIGPDCTIDRIEYKESLELDESAKVGAQQKI